MQTHRPDGVVESGMKGKRIWIAGLGLASLLCLFLDTFPRSVVPLVVFLYLCMPGPDRERQAEERRARSRAVRKKRPPGKIPVRILEHAENETAAVETIPERETAP